MAKNAYGQGMSGSQSEDHTGRDDLKMYALAYSRESGSEPSETEFRNSVDSQYAAEAQAHHQAQYPTTDCGMGPDTETVSGADFSADSLIESEDTWDLGEEFGAGETF